MFAVLNIVAMVKKLTHPNIKAISFTGGTKTWHIAKSSTF